MQLRKPDEIRINLRTKPGARDKTLRGGLVPQEQGQRPALSAYSIGGFRCSLFSSCTKAKHVCFTAVPRLPPTLKYFWELVRDSLLLWGRQQQQTRQGKQGCTPEWRLAFFFSPPPQVRQNFKLFGWVGAVFLACHSPAFSSTTKTCNYLYGERRSDATPVEHEIYLAT